MDREKTDARNIGRLMNMDRDSIFYEQMKKTGIRETTVRTVLFRLRKQLKTHLEKEDVL